MCAGWEPYDLYDIAHVSGRLDLYSTYTDVAQHLRTAGTGSTVDDLDDL